MQVNLNVPFTNQMSVPQKFIFYSKQNDDLMFGKNDDIEIYCSSVIKAVSVKWTISRNMFDIPFDGETAEPLPSYSWRIKINTKALYPGFYDIKITADLGNGLSESAICTFGYDAPNMKINFNRPGDFNDFWQQSLKSLSSVELDAEISDKQTFVGKQIDCYNVLCAALPADYDKYGHSVNEVEAYKVSFASVNETRIYGRLAKPKCGGKLPAMIIFPGAGFASRPIPLEHARHGYLALDIQVHGQEVDSEEYKPSEAFETRNDFSNPNNYYYNDIYLHCIQAVNYICSRDDVDTDNIILVGGSQGGRLSITTAALDNRIKAVVAAIAHHSNIPYLKWAEEQSGIGNGMDCEMSMKSSTLPNNIAYYDIMNFAPDIHCPVLMNAGLIDKVSPPSGVFAVYNLLSSEIKEIVPIQGIAHDWSAEFDRYAWKWLKQLNFKR